MPVPDFDKQLRFSRREWLKLAAIATSPAGMAGSSSSWLKCFAADAASRRDRHSSCILLWMPGGPSQTDTFDMKPGHDNGGPFQPIETSVPGIQISEHLPLLAQQMEKMAIIRSMQTHEADHGRASFYLRTGYKPQGGIQYPSLGAIVSKQNEDPESAMPGCISVASPRLASDSSYGAGYLGPRFAPMLVGDTTNLADLYNPDRGSAISLGVPELLRPDGFTAQQYQSRVGLLQQLQRPFAEQHPGIGVQTIVSSQDRALRLSASPLTRSFDLKEEPETLRQEYGMNLFGQSCLLARRMVEINVPFIELTLGGWDTHIQNFTAVRQLSRILDKGWATLMRDLSDRGLLDSTLVVWMGEFGRTPTINPQQGRDHFPTAWSTVLAGGGIRGGQVYGRTSPDGTQIDDSPVSVPDLLATVCAGWASIILGSFHPMSVVRSGSSIKPLSPFVRCSHDVDRQLPTERDFAADSIDDGLFPDRSRGRR